MCDVWRFVCAVWRKLFFFLNRVLAIEKNCNVYAVEPRCPSLKRADLTAHIVVGIASIHLYQNGLNEMNRDVIIHVHVIVYTLFFTSGVK